MKNSFKKGFTLVELLVVITILSIISVVAYQSFSGATSSAVAARKLSDVTTIESSLQQYKTKNNRYPAVDLYSNASGSEQYWGYDATKNAQASNTLTVTTNNNQITAVNPASTGGGKVLGLNGTVDYSTTQIGSKGTISQKTLTKQFLTKDLYDPELGDVKVSDKKMVDYGIGRYVYAIYREPLPAGGDWGAGDNRKGSYYNIAYTVKKEDSDVYMTIITGDYDNASCVGKEDACPESLIGPGATVLTNKNTQTEFNTSNVNQGIPYPVTEFTETP